MSTTNITQKHLHYLNPHVRHFINGHTDSFGFDDLIHIVNQEDFQGLNNKSIPYLIIFASEMTKAGKIKHPPILPNIGNVANTMLLENYAKLLSLFGRLSSRAGHAIIFGDSYVVKVKMEVIDSVYAHGVCKDMVKCPSCQQPEKVLKMFIINGEKGGREFSKSHLKNQNLTKICIPSLHDSHHL